MYDYQALLKAALHQRKSCGFINNITRSMLDDLADVSAWERDLNLLEEKTRA